MGGASKIFMLISTPFPLLYPRPSALRLVRHSRLPLASFSSAVHNRLLFSNSGSRPGFFVRAAESVHTQTSAREGYGESLGALPIFRAPHPWPEWSKLVDHLVAGGYSGRRGSVAAGDDDDSFSVYDDLPEEFVKVAEACLSFARDRPDVLRLLTRKNIEAIVENGSPFLFKNGVISARRMSLFLSGDGSTVSESEAQTVDVMRYVLSYAYNPLANSYESNLKSRELVEASVRNLLVELVNVNGTVRESKLAETTPRQPPLRHGQFSRPPGQNIEMKRGDWICPKCSFMNFARNMRCLDCDEGRPKMQLTGAEWECPQCDFLNYGRNMACLRCDCKRPGEARLSAASQGAGLGYNSNTSVDQILSGSNTDKSEIERRLVASDEKAERWFSKVSQLDDSSDLSSAVADEDFPEIMPLRKGVNRFVVSTRKTPLERRLANFQSGGISGTGSDKTSESSISRSLDRILGRSSTSSETNQQPAAGEANTGAGSRFNSPDYRKSIANQRGDPDYVPFAPLPADMFSKSQKSNNDVLQPPDKEDPAYLKAGEKSDSPSKSSESLTGNNTDRESSDSSERWYKKVAELDNVTDLASAIPDEDFPEIMPMRKGENRFVVSKKKDRSLTSPQYKRRLAMEQASSSNFVPFVPFPPDYFAKKDKNPEAAVPNKEAAIERSAPPEKAQGMPEKLEEGASNWGSVGKISQQPESGTYRGSYNTQFSGKNLNESKFDTVYGASIPNSAQPLNHNSKESWNSGMYKMNSASNGASGTGSSTQQAENSQNTKENWNRGFSGKSLEGSAVKEPDPLDMSEEAKAERWFRRVAQIKDISELSQIPDEDFPEIMPMRKGVNRFVVSKRKTPLERRLTSPQYRRNLPIVSSEPEKDPS